MMIFIGSVNAHRPAYLMIINSFTGSILKQATFNSVMRGSAIFNSLGKILFTL
jgi:hypothetical protein